MTLSQFISKLNWRLILVHLLACWFIYYAATEFWILSDYKFLHRLVFGHLKDNYDLKGNYDYGRRLSLDLMWMGLAELIGVLIAFAVSLVITIYKKWFWFNSIVMLIISISVIVLWGLLKIKFTPWHYLKEIFLTPGSLFDNTIWFFVINGSLLLAIGLCLFFLKPVNRFVEGKKAFIEPLDTKDQADAYEPIV